MNAGLKTYFGRSVAGAAVAFALVSMQAHAQEEAAQADDAAASAVGMQDIVVTAQFRGQRLQDTPIAITATTGETLEAKNLQSVTDLTGVAPNVNLTAATGLNGSAVQAYIRGVGQNDSNFALEPGVGIYIDDVYYGTTFGAILDLTDLDRVEVLRGPQGTLAGKNSIGGSVKLFSRKPDENGGGFVEASTGSYDRLDLRASAGFTIADGLYARISGVSKRTDGFMKLLDYGCVNPGEGIASTRGGTDCQTGTEGGIDVQGIRAALRYAPAGSPLEINLIGDYAQNNSEQVATKLIYANNPAVRSYDAADPNGGVPMDSRFITGSKSYTSYASYVSGGNYTTVFGTPYQVQPGDFVSSPRSTAKSYGISGSIDYALSDTLSLKSITSYRKASGTSGIDLDGSPLNVVLQQFSYSHKQFTQELRLSGKVGDFADYTVGGYYYDADDLQTGRNQIISPLFDFLLNDPVTNRSKSVFAHVELHPAPDFNIIGGIRYTDDKKTYQFSRRNLDGSLPSGIPLTMNWLLAGLDGETGTYKGDRVDYRIGANYRFSPELMVYAQFSTGYKGGGINPRPYTVDQITTFDPETLNAYEAGFKADLLDRKVRLNGAVFFNDYKNLQINRYFCPETASSTCSMPANAGNAEVFGFEAELSAQPVDGLMFDASVGYLDFKYTDVDPTTGVTLDMVAPFNPSWQASAGLQYRVDLGNAGSITPRLDWNYQSSFYFNSVNNADNQIEARSLFNLRVSYRDVESSWELSAGATNLFDKFYYVGKSENVGNYGLNTGALGRPREWFVTLKRNF
ncbi:TonB-dependent receptor [Sphingobium jiangsuense]|uniref:Iron complex outermembrane receptor protein n=1 Tax=Sphingobium jiangsuense TaxID=870476 RepID=A0A7W6FQX8_9SPHN|nr:TonB-dependent receptor [Sphingobium jiangsuense]MBB3927420.1 iron complex outermembrane receptor protein [Sphingobium jiangsuense]GLT02413.1 TonB-dependent receptor [Sphingobium jiangsuense]